MRKSFTKIICAVTAAIAASGVLLVTACDKDYRSSGVKDKDPAENVYSNGGFAVHTDDYVYFINGIASNSGNNTYGEVLKGSVQRISKDDLAEHNYSETQTIVPLITYSSYYQAGIYIYGDYIYHATPSTEKNSDGVVQNSKLEFKRTKLDGSSTSGNSFYTANSASLAYRYVEVDGTVYLVYALCEDLYGSTTTNIHSINTSNGADTLLAYNVSSYMFDEYDPENPYIYYTMKVTYKLGSENSFDESYNQIYRVRADTKQSPRDYDFSYVTSGSEVRYVNLGDFVYDGIGNTDISQGRYDQFNFGYGSQTEYSVTHRSYTYALSSYRNGELLYTRQNGGDSATGLYKVTDSAVDTDDDGKIDPSWNAIYGNDSAERVFKSSPSGSYVYLSSEYGGRDNAVLYAGSNGLMMGSIVDGELKDEYYLTDSGSPTVLTVRKEDISATESHWYVYYSLTGGNGYTIYRISIDGESTDYATNRYPESEDVSLYTQVQILDLDTSSSWYSPEFIDNQILFASQTKGMTSLSYIMACDLNNAEGYMMSNAEISEYTEKYNGVLEKITENDEDESDAGYDYRTSTLLNYVFYTGDSDYVYDLIKAYEDAEGKTYPYPYEKESVKLYENFVNPANGASGNAWADFADDSKTVNGKTVYANSQSYYYCLLGRMTDGDAKAYKDSIKTSASLPAYPVKDSVSWWDGLSAVAKAFFIIGMIFAGALIISVGVAAAIVIVNRKNRTGETVGRRLKIDITDDKDIDVYGDQN